MLVEAELLSPEQAAAAREAARRERLPLSRVLVRDGLVLARELATLLALHLGMAMVDLRSQSIDPQAVALVDEEVARKNLVLALKLDENRLNRGHVRSHRPAADPRPYGPVRQRHRARGSHSRGHSGARGGLLPAHRQLEGGAAG